MTSLDHSNQASMIPRIGSLVARVMQAPALAVKVTGTTDLVNEIGLDSLQMIDFLLALEEEFQVEVDFDSLDMQHLTSVDALCRFVLSLRANADAGGAPQHASAVRQDGSEKL